jgi:predicted metal-dependent hydrolase
MSQINNYSIIYRKVKNLRIEVSRDNVKVIVPLKYNEKVENVLGKYEKWINEKIKKLKEVQEISNTLPLYNHENLKEIIENYVEEYGKILKKKPEKILFRKMKNRWASCHYKDKKIIFNKKLKFLPESLIKYVVLHEMCHLIVKNHRKEFYLLVKKIDENFENKENLLLSYKFKTSMMI